MDYSRLSIFERQYLRFRDNIFHDKYQWSGIDRPLDNDLFRLLENLFQFIDSHNKNFLSERISFYKDFPKKPEYKTLAEQFCKESQLIADDLLLKPITEKITDSPKLNTHQFNNPFEHTPLFWVEKDMNIIEHQKITGNDYKVNGKRVAGWIPYIAGWFQVDPTLVETLISEYPNFKDKPNLAKSLIRQIIKESKRAEPFTEKDLWEFINYGDLDYMAKIESRLISVEATKDRQAVVTDVLTKVGDPSLYLIRLENKTLLRDKNWIYGTFGTVVSLLLKLNREIKGKKERERMFEKIRYLDEIETKIVKLSQKTPFLYDEILDLREQYCHRGLAYFEDGSLPPEYEYLRDFRGSESYDQRNDWKLFDSNFDSVLVYLSTKTIPKTLIAPSLSKTEIIQKKSGPEGYISDTDAMDVIEVSFGDISLTFNENTGTARGIIGAHQVSYDKEDPDHKQEILDGLVTLYLLRHEDWNKEKKKGNPVKWVDLNKYNEKHHAFSTPFKKSKRKLERSQNKEGKTKNVTAAARLSRGRSLLKNSKYFSIPKNKKPIEMNCDIAETP